MQTLKIPYAVAEFDELAVYDFRRQYAICLRSAFNRILDGMSDSNVYAYLKQLNSVELMKSSMLKSIILYARIQVDRFKKIRNQQEEKLESLTSAIASIERNPNKRTKAERKIAKSYSSIKRANLNYVFGGKKLLSDLAKGKITKEEFLDRRLGIFEIVGSKEDYGNQLFRISSFKTAVIFRPSKKIRIAFNFKGLSKSQKLLINTLYEHQLMCDVPITYGFDGQYIYIKFDEKEVYGIKRFDKKKNRVLAVDQNPNYLGWSIVDWNDDSSYRIVKSGVFSLKPLNDKNYACFKQKQNYFTKKRITEQYNIAKKIVEIGIHFRCDIFALEDLDFSKSHSKNSSRYNRLTLNFWNRRRFESNIVKRCSLFDFQLIKVPPQYSSKFGNVLFRELNLPDMVNASIEIGRRAFEFNRQYIEKSKEQSKTIIHPDLTHFSDVLAKSMEEFGITEECKDLYELFGVLAKRKKNAEMLYRVPFDDKITKWFKFSSTKSSVVHCVFTEDSCGNTTNLCKAHQKHVTEAA